jgi:hypothetical protein
MQNAYRTLVLRPEENGMLGKSTHTGEDNIKMDVKENRVGDCGLD